MKLQVEGFHLSTRLLFHLPKHYTFSTYNLYTLYIGSKIYIHYTLYIYINTYIRFRYILVVKQNTYTFDVKFE